MSRAAAEIEPVSRMLSSSLVLPGPIRAPDSKTMLTLTRAIPYCARAAVQIATVFPSRVAPFLPNKVEIHAVLKFRGSRTCVRIRLNQLFVFLSEGWNSYSGRKRRLSASDIVALRQKWKPVFESRIWESFKTGLREDVIIRDMKRNRYLSRGWQWKRHLPVVSSWLSRNLPPGDSRWHGVGNAYEARYRRKKLEAHQLWGG